MIRRQRGSLVWYEFELLQPFSCIRHGCFTISSSLNLSFSSDDDRALVKHNRDQVLSTLFGRQSSTPSPPYPRVEAHHETASYLIDMHQVHGAEIALINTPFPPILPCDAMATSLSNAALLVKHADCQAGLLFDPEHKVIAAVHSGWRGSVQNIFKASVDRLKAVWGSREEKLLACISPSLGPCHAEFRDWQEKLPPSFAPFHRGDDHFDFWEITRSQLLSCGLSPSHIEIAQMCTYCHQDLFFSYRRDKTQKRNGTCIGITSSCDERG